MKEARVNWITYSVRKEDGEWVRAMLADNFISTQFVHATPTTYKFRLSSFYEARADELMVEYVNR